MATEGDVVVLLDIGQSNWPVRAPVVKADHWARVQVSTGPAGFFESRTARWLLARWATSTQLPDAAL